MDYGVIFSDRLNKTIEEMGITNAEAARISGVTACTIAGWRRGRNMPDSYNLASLCVALGVSADWMLGIENDD